MAVSVVRARQGRASQANQAGLSVGGPCKDTQREAIQTLPSQRSHSNSQGTAAERHPPPGGCHSRPLTGTLMPWALDPQSPVRVSLRPPQKSHPNPAVAEEPSRLARHSSGATAHRLSAVVAVAPAGLCGPVPVTQEPIFYWEV